ncbi:MAG: hypothetical protein Q4G22_09720 [Paracoccus sp. (in: a-proteobacteria)]|uniref:hypothetical protein n=1 Tax=Paracoccus sp. TaxID=267 RepID=UPI0026DEFED5|nr:hypothetical protein [Paracoccus sp. (in: a-proteobacteria)]MDO5632105.1 hypothetical protein [Paracoccus sp. (in: a-proteobacteria)]
MSHNPNPEKQTRKHSPALLAILVALVVAAMVFFVFGGSDPSPDDLTQVEVPQTGQAAGTDTTPPTPAVEPTPGDEPPQAEGQPATSPPDETLPTALSN